MFIFGLYFMVLVCLLVGYLFVPLALVIVTFVVVSGWVCLSKTVRGKLPAVIPGAFAIAGAFSLIGMWGMYLLTSEQTFLHDLLVEYLLR